MIMEEMLTVREVSRMLNVHGNTVRNWSAAGLFPEYRLTTGNHRRYKKSDIDAYIASSLQARKSPTLLSQLLESNK